MLIVLSNMATSDLEERQLELEGKTCSLPAKKLEELAEHLEVPLTKYSGKITGSPVVKSVWSYKYRVCMESITK